MAAAAGKTSTRAREKGTPTNVANSGINNGSGPMRTAAIAATLTKGARWLA